MNILYTILYIILFIFCLSVLVVVHELGHFATAKFFNVYVKEFSIGFGPALFHKRRKNGETYFSLRAIPFGGYVSMYGESAGEEEDPEHPNIDPSRSFTSLKKWKRIIILFSGVFNNAILALVLFLISESCFEQKMMYLSLVNVAPDTPAAAVKLEDGSSISLRTYYSTEDKKTYYIVDKENAYVTQGTVDTPVYAMIDTTNITFSSRDYQTYLKFYLKDSAGNVVTGHEFKANEVDSVRYTVTKTQGKYVQYIGSSWVEVPDAIVLDPQVGQAYINKEEKAIFKWDGSSWKKTSYDYYGYDEPQDKIDYFIWYNSEYTLTPYQLSLKVETTKEGNKVFENSGISIYLDRYWNNAGQVAKNTFIDFGNSATAIARGLGSLFTSADNWKDVGGVIAIGQQTTNILQNFGLAKFIYIWGLISVNLAIINLLPFPGLDGWQIVVLIVEAVAHREIPEKVKNIMSLIGLALLFSFMILILIKDFIGLF